MGDSNGSMYGKMVKELAKDLGLTLNVVSVAGGDPLPHSFGQQSPLWLASLTIVKRERPEFLIFACNWTGQLKDDKDRLDLALRELKELAHVVILITQPPELPKIASREGMREGESASIL